MAEKIPCGGFQIDGVSLVVANGVMSAPGGGGAVPNATTQVAGIVKQAETIADITAAPTQADFNGLLAALKTAGIMA